MSLIARLVYAVLLMAACLSVLVGCEKNQPSEESAHQPVKNAEETGMKAVSREELVATLESHDFDQTVLVMNRVKAMHYQGDLIPIIKNIWEGQLSESPRVDKAFIDHPRIRLEVADVLLQASRNGSGFSLKPNAYSEYARKFANSEDTDVAMHAILVLGIANDPSDLPLFEKILAEENNANYSVAAIAYTENCAVTKEKIERLASTLKRTEVREYLNKLWLDMRESRQFSCRK